MSKARITTLIGVFTFLILLSSTPKKSVKGEISDQATLLTLVQNKEEGTISILREGESDPILVQNATEDFRPYIHPVLAPDGKGVLTEYSPGHHKHQTGLYWGFTRVNGRDYFHNPQGDYWKKVALNIVEETGEQVKWQTIYQLLDSLGGTVLEETQNWTMSEANGEYILDLEWKGEAKTEVTIGQYDYGSLFVRMPWKDGIDGEIINAARQKNMQAEGQPAMWINVGLKVEGREDRANVAIFDHPENRGYPNKWRVDGQMGLGPAFTRDGDWVIEEGNTETIKLRLLVYTGEANDLKLKESWGNFSGREGMYSTTELWGLAQEEGRNAKFLTAEEAVDAMTIKSGYKVNVWASEPMMTQPMAFCWDDRGRLWIAENKDYESRGDGFSNSGDSRILILEDTDGDGEADSQKVFMEGLAFPAALAVGFDGVFIGAPPNLIFVPDKNGDDKADMDNIEILLTGWGIRDRHETLNSLHWGPDGWLYGLQGFATPSKIRKPTGDAKLYYHKDQFPEDLLEAEGVDINGGVWRYHPIKERFEVVAHGFSNPWGIDYDAKGQLFMSACVIPHLWHVVPGGIYHRQGGQHFNPYVYEDIKTIANHSHRSAHGGARIYQSDAFPKEEQGRIFMANIHEHGVLSDILIPKGSGFEGEHGDEFMMANNAQWVGFSMEIGPDGGLYALDWHDADICGKEVLNEETGRIFRIMPENSLAQNFAGRYSDLNKMTDAQLVALQTNPSDWHSRRARGILHKRAVNKTLQPGTNDALKTIFVNDNNPDWRLRAMWTIHQIGGFSEKELVASLSDKDPYIRAWSIQLLCEDMKPSTEALTKFRTMADSDPSPVVRLYLTAALQRIPTSEKWDIAESLIQHTEDEKDHNLPKMLWYGIEPLFAEYPDKFLELAPNSQLTFVTQNIARRAVDGNQPDKLVTLIGKGGQNTELLMAGMLSGMEGRTDLKTPANWKSVAETLQKSGGKKQELALEISGLFGDTEATQRAFATLQDKNSPIDQRRKALQILTAQQQKALPAEIPALLQEPTLRKDAIRAIAAFDNEDLGKILLENYPNFSPEEKLEAMQTLSSRARYGNMLTQELKKQTIAKSEVPASVARQLLRVVGSGFIEVWGPIESVPSNQAAYDKYREMITPTALGSANIKSGKTVFAKSCGSCHKMYGEGGIIGPDLTGSNRTDPEYILMNVLEPSAEIQDDYKMVVINTRDGRTYSGNIIGENERQITMRIVGQDQLIINKSAILSREVTEVSMMPSGLFENLTQTEIIDLVEYLKTNKRID
ncbi:PVC-type heme-binding CxxCH protein [Algoriphagus sp. C2-6-M1]|uniref:PVC-type heme-binding CxxCH protein n=1 Tax=Algoriphagus persicinus TaxID=3108754 RepID=UPI002B3CE0CB|nr:PVC-type heme-binding CxxCH protein [Algoriphagus sp. C2-6-M1]MEB2781479.1 PVC-type heme-binding CxxCH protein [Algoriphagus sp. C2-6-M1]